MLEPFRKIQSHFGRGASPTRRAAARGAARNPGQADIARANGAESSIWPLALESPRWNRLQHSQGRATDMPHLLKRLSRDTSPKNDLEAEPWFTLWSRLCFRGDVFTASYAAVPHIVQFCRNAKGPVDFSFFMLPACVEIARQKGNGPQVPAELSDAYDVSLQQLHECAHKQSAYPWDDSMVISVACAQAAAKGQTKLAEAISNLDVVTLELLLDTGG